MNLRYLLFTTGQQPCYKFRPSKYDDGPLSNEHDCPSCNLRVRFCSNCLKDHHLNGLESCNNTENKA